MTDCFDCKWQNFKYEGLPNNEYYCEKFKCETPDFYCKEQEECFTCSAFERLKSCCNCKNCNPTIYETGTIDSIDYHCKLQDNKMMYSDTNAYNTHNFDFLECPIGSWNGGE